MTGSSGPPRLALFLLRFFVGGEAREFLEGDLREEFHEHVARAGRGSASLWFWRQAIGTVAHRCAHRVLGGHVAREERRESVFRRERWYGGFGTDVGNAARALWRRPGPTVLVVGIISVGVGAATSVFSVADWILFRPVPGVETPAERLALVQMERPDGNYTGVSYPNLKDLEAGAPAVERISAIATPSLQVAGADVEPLTLSGEAVTDGYFEALEITAYHGRLFSPEEMKPDAEGHVAVVSHRFWSQELGADSDVVGRELMVNGARYQVIGVAGRGFRGIDRVGDTDLWFPPARYLDLRHYGEAYTLSDRALRPFMRAIVRLTPGATRGQAEAQLREVMERLVDALPEENGIHGEYRPTVHADIGISPNSASYFRRLVEVMFGVATLLLLIASANVANLLIFRATRRQGDVAVRRAMGASRLRIVRQHMAEALLLAVAGGVFALLFAAGLNHILWTEGGVGVLGVLNPPPLDLRAWLFALATAVTVPLGFALVPAIISSRTDLARSLQASRPTETGRRARLRSGLTVIQLALSLALGLGSLLLVRTLDRLADVDPGFDPAGMMVFAVDPEPQGYDSAEGVDLQLNLLERVREIPGVASATLARTEPFRSGNAYGRVVRSPPADDETLDVQYEWIGADYFRTFGIPILRGRDFQEVEVDPGAPVSGEVVILNRSLAEVVFGTIDVIGRAVTIDEYRSRSEKRIVGVVADIRDDLRREPEPMLYEPLPNSWSSQSSLILTATAGRDHITTEVRRALAGIDPNVPVYRASTIGSAIREQMAEERLLARLLGILSVLAAGLATAGLYGVVAWTVAERTRELGIRIAMGADPRELVGWVARQALWLALLGIAVGLGASIVVSGALERLLFGVDRFDLATWATAASLVLVVSVMAAAHPAVRAAAVDPVDALRAD